MAARGRAAHLGYEDNESPRQGGHPSRESSASGLGVHGLGYAAKGKARRVPDPLVDGWVDWLMPQHPRVMGTVNTRFPLSMAQHERVGRRLQELYKDRCGEAPTVLVAVQENPSREGYHSHPLACGTGELLTVRRKDVWAELMSELRLQHGGGQHWVDAGGGFDPKGGAFYRQPATAADAYNAARVRLEPVRTPEDVMGYATRYGVRMGDGLIVLLGDHWQGPLVLT